MLAADSIQKQLGQHIENLMSLANNGQEAIARASEHLVQCLLAGQHIYIAADAKFSALANHLASILQNRYYVERPSFPVISLNADSQTLLAIQTDYGAEQVFAKPLSALGKSGDCLIVLSDVQTSSSLNQVLSVCATRNMSAIVLGGQFASDDPLIHIPITSKGGHAMGPIFLVVLNTLCAMIDFQIFGHEE